MIIGIGTDIVNINAFVQMPEKRKERSFTTKEIEYCESKQYPEQHYAARWAAKEAFIKASRHTMAVGMKNIEVQHNASGSVFLCFTGERLLSFADRARCYLSISHTVDYATAVVLCESIS